MTRGLVAAMLLLTSCQPTMQASPSAPSPPSRVSPPPAGHVFVIVLENASYDQAMQQPEIASLATTYAVATNYFAVATPSLPNYLAMTSGSTWGIEDNEYHELPATGLGTELTRAGISWKAYMEGLTGDCFDSPYPYAVKHNPFAYYGGHCPSNVVPLSQLASDLAAQTPKLSWITPGLCNDGHDCGLAVAGRWLAGVVSQVIASAAWQQDGVLFVTWDEPGAGDNRVPLIIVAPGVRGREASMRLDHYSLLATIVDRFGLPRPGEASQAKSLDSLIRSWAKGK